MLLTRAEYLRRFEGGVFAVIQPLIGTNDVRREQERRLQGLLGFNDCHPFITYPRTLPNGERITERYNIHIGDVLKHTEQAKTGEWIVYEIVYAGL